MRENGWMMGKMRFGTKLRLFGSMKHDVPRRRDDLFEQHRRICRIPGKDLERHMYLPQRRFRKFDFSISIILHSYVQGHAMR